MSREALESLHTIGKESAGLVALKSLFLVDPLSVSPEYCNRQILFVEQPFVVARVARPLSKYKPALDTLAVPVFKAELPAS